VDRLPDTTERNLDAATIGRHVRLPRVVSRRREWAFARSLWDRFDIRGRGIGQDVLTLSGATSRRWCSPDPSRFHRGRVAARFERDEADEETLLHECYGRIAA